MKAYLMFYIPFITALIGIGLYTQYSTPTTPGVRFSSVVQSIDYIGACEKEYKRKFDTTATGVSFDDSLGPVCYCSTKE